MADVVILGDRIVGGQVGWIKLYPQTQKDSKIRKCLIFLFLSFLLEESWIALDILVYWSRYVRSGIVNIRSSFWLNHGVFSFQPQVSGSVDEVAVEEETG